MLLVWNDTFGIVCSTCMSIVSIITLVYVVQTQKLGIVFILTGFGVVGPKKCALLKFSQQRSPLTQQF